MCSVDISDVIGEMVNQQFSFSFRIVQGVLICVTDNGRCDYGIV